MIFDNPHFTKEITVDLDGFFFFFVRPKNEQPKDEKQGITLDYINHLLNRMNDILPLTLSPIVYYRRSSNDHVHVKLTFPEKVTVLDGFMVRAFLKDDQTRLSLDLARYLKTSDLHEMNRCFDEKATLTEVKRAGPWIPIYLPRTGYYGEFLKDYNEYLPRWREYCKVHGINSGIQTDLGFC